MNHHHSHHHEHGHHQINLKKKKTGWVLLISIVTMFLEISFGYITNSMALLSEGWHMASHVIAIGAGWLVYQYVDYQHKKNKEINTSKALAYVGFLNALSLAIIAVFIIIESIERYYEPLSVKYMEAILIAIIGLVVNLISAKILHHDEEHSDHNIRAAYLHVVADVLTSVLAIIALLVGLYFKFIKADAIVGVIGALVILYWAKGIILQAGKEIFVKQS